MDFRNNLPFKLWHVKANMQIRYNSLRAIFAHFRDQRLSGSTKSRNNLNDNQSVESCFRRYRLVLPAKERRDTALHTLRMGEVLSDIQAPLSLLFRRRSILKLFRRLTVGYALPGTPLEKTKDLWLCSVHI